MSGRRRRKTEDDDDDGLIDPRTAGGNLLFDGSWLGDMNFIKLVYYWNVIDLKELDPNAMWFEAIITYGDGQQYPVWIRRTEKRYLRDISLIDELKTVYGIGKIGTHSFSCINAPVPDPENIGGWTQCKKRVYFVCFKIEVDTDDDGNYVFQDPVTAHTKEGLMSSNDKYRSIVSKNMLFFELLGINYKGLKQFVWIRDRLVSLPLNFSPNLSIVRKPSATISGLFFNRLWHKQELLEEMLGFNQYTYEDFYDNFLDRLTTLLKRMGITDPTKTEKLLPFMREKIDRRMVFYYSASAQRSKPQVFVPDPEIDIMFI